MNNGQTKLSTDDLAKMSTTKAVEALLQMQPKEAAHLVVQLPEHKQKQVKDELFDQHYRFYSSMDMELVVEGLNEYMLRKK